MRLHPLRMASSTMRSFTSRHNKAPDASVSVSPTCRPALSQSSCKGRGANRSRALITSFIFTLLQLKYNMYSACKVTCFCLSTCIAMPFFNSFSWFVDSWKSVSHSFVAAVPLLFSARGVLAFSALCALCASQVMVESCTLPMSNARNACVFHVIVRCDE